MITLYKNKDELHKFWRYSAFNCGKNRLLKRLLSIITANHLLKIQYCFKSKRNWYVFCFFSFFKADQGKISSTRQRSVSPFLLKFDCNITIAATSKQLLKTKNRLIGIENELRRYKKLQRGIINVFSLDLFNLWNEAILIELKVLPGFIGRHNLNTTRYIDGIVLLTEMKPQKVVKESERKGLSIQL